ncbi:MAG TPA: hypothetical protein VFT22_14095 [Kofleriaceae bacterium]|nr:hypothetical protein [Kofleriaceae bacterium]
MNRCASGALAIIAAACGKGGTTSGAPVEAARASGTRAPAAAAPDRDPGSPASPASRASPPHPAASWTCDSLPFAESTPVPEASGSAWLEIDGKLGLVIVGDSGNHGAYGVIDPETGATIETGKLPLSGEVSDDIEGLSARAGQLVGLTSSGWILVWRRKDKGFELVGPPYPLGPIDLPDTKNNDRAPRGDGMVCNGRVVNCGRNYEGLCLAPVPRPGAACIGFAASKADGHLYCLTDSGGKLVVHHDRSIPITHPGALADCAFGDDDRLWVGNNLFDFGNVYAVSHWEDPATAQVERVGALIIGFPELIAARGDVIYRMSDMGGSPSLMTKYRCHRS